MPDAGSRMPREPVVSASTDGVVWKEIDRRKEDKTWAANEVRLYRLAKPVSKVTQLRFDIKDSYQPGILRMYHFFIE